MAPPAAVPRSRSGPRPRPPRSGERGRPGLPQAGSHDGGASQGRGWCPAQWSRPVRLWQLPWWWSRLAHSHRREGQQAGTRRDAYVAFARTDPAEAQRAAQLWQLPWSLARGLSQALVPELPQAPGYEPRAQRSRRQPSRQRTRCVPHGRAGRVRPTAPCS